MSAIKEYARRMLGELYCRLSSAHSVQTWNALIKSGTATVGRFSYGVPIVYCFRGNSSRLHIGSFSSITTGVKILLGGNHPTNWVTTFPLRAKMQMVGAFEDGMPASKGDVRIGCDVWIGMDSIIMSGVCIGHGAVVTAGSVVIKDIEPYAIVGGVPAKIIRMRFSEKTIEALMRIQWWNWEEKRIRGAAHLICSDKIEEFIKEHGREFYI